MVSMHPRKRRSSHFRASAWVRIGYSGDGCSPACRREPQCPPAGGTCTSVCGDGLILPTDTDQECDDGNSASGEDGCSADCKVEPGYACSSAPVVPSGTSEVRYWFQYSGGEQLAFSGDDDVSYS